MLQKLRARICNRCEMESLHIRFHTKTQANTSSTELLPCPLSAPSLAGPGGERKVGAPSIVLNSGFVRPPFSNSWAEIFRTGVPDPDPELERVEESSLTEYRLIWNQVWAIFMFSP